jgi:hypothetical protein
MLVPLNQHCEEKRRGKIFVAPFEEFLKAYGTERYSFFSFSSTAGGGSG